MPSSLVPIQGVARFGITNDENVSGPSNGNGYLTSSVNDLHGTGHMGVAPLNRIIMSLKSGIESEIEYALSTLTYYSCHEPSILNFQTYPLLGNELINYFVKPYHDFSAGKFDSVSKTALSLSAESLLSLRNAVQDLGNQQWLCQKKNFRKFAVEALKFLVKWFYGSESKSYAMSKANDTLRESLMYLLDILDPLTCFYVDNPRNDPLFAQMLSLLIHSNDKHVLKAVINCLQHLLYLGGAGSFSSTNPEEPETNNCIDSIQAEHLNIIVQALLVNDDEIIYAALSFLKQYLSSEALHSQHKSSIEASQLYRLQKVAEVHDSKSNLRVLLKQLPELIVAKLPLVDPLSLPQKFPIQLKKRSTYSGVPTATAKLPPKLYDIVVTFPEPLRATTWLRCCYEPFSIQSRGESESGSTAGEVTQISLWKSYENQFEAIWKDRFNPKWPNLLPAVDFIKNVSSAFPNSEAMVVNIPSLDPTQPAKKKFIIKGIQPRQFPVSIDTGNFEALRKGTSYPDEKSSGKTEVGDVDRAVFDESLSTFSKSILSASEGLTGPYDTNAPWFSPINALSKEILGTIIKQLLQNDKGGELKGIFKEYNEEWLPDLVFANPGLIDNHYFDGAWLSYLL